MNGARIPIEALMRQLRECDKSRHTIYERVCCARTIRTINNQTIQAESNQPQHNIK